MHVRPIEFGSAEYEAAKALRRRFLREPLGLELSADDLAGEESQHHFGLFDAGGELLGAVVGKPDPDDEATVRIRQMVIHEDRRGGGLGRQLLNEAERLLLDFGFDKLVLFARDEATPFYERCGYSLTGRQKELIGLPHREMRKHAAS